MTNPKIKLSVFSLCALLWLFGKGAAVLADAPADDAALAGKLKVDWTAVTFTMTKANPLVPPGQGNYQDSQSLVINGQILIIDQANIIGFDRMSNLNISKIVDDTDRDLSSLLTGNSPEQRWYAPLGYTSGYDPDSHGFTERLAPQPFSIQLKVEGPLPNRIAVVEGFVSILTCEKMEHVDVPYVNDGPATAVLPSTKLHFKTATQNANSYSYELVNEGDIEQQGFGGQVSDRQPLPDRAILNKYLVDADGKPVANTRHAFGNFSGANSENGSGGMQGSDRIAAMRFDVAVGLKEHKIPVTLKNIEIPKLQVEGKTLPTVPADVSPLEQAEQELARRLADERDRASQTGWTDAKDQHVRDLWKAFKADFDTGVKMKVTPVEVMGVVPDVTSYEQYVGKYTITPPRARRSSGNHPPTTQEGAETMSVEVEKDAHGRLTLNIASGKMVSLAPRDGGLFGAFDPIIMPSDSLDPKSEPKLAGLWIVRSGGKTILYTINGHEMPPIVMEPVAGGTLPQP